MRWATISRDHHFWQNCLQIWTSKAFCLLCNGPPKTTGHLFILKKAKDLYEYTTRVLLQDVPSRSPVLSSVLSKHLDQIIQIFSLSQCTANPISSLLSCSTSPTQEQALFIGPIKPISLSRAIIPGEGAPRWAEDTVFPILCSISALMFVTLLSTAGDQNDIFTELICISSYISAFLFPPQRLQKSSVGTKCVDSICVAFYSVRGFHHTYKHECSQNTWDLLEQGQSRNTAGGFLCSPGISHLSHQFPCVTLKYRVGLTKCKWEELSINLLPREKVAALFSSSLAPPMGFIVFASGFPVLSCIQEFPVQTYRFVYSSFRCQDSLFISTSHWVIQKSSSSFSPQTKLSLASAMPQHPPTTT